MKSLKILAIIIGSFIANPSIAQKKAGTAIAQNIKVWGNCGMCKKTIEKAAKKAGAATANWNEETKVLKVSYNTNKSSGQKIQEAIANSGYDTEAVKASDAAYNKLHACCQYERKN